MNIAIISYWTCPFTRWGELYAGGLNVYVVHLANNVGELGHQVDIYTRMHKEDEEKFLKIQKNVRLFHLSSASSDLYKDPEYFAGKILKLAKENMFSYDIIHAHFYYSGLTGLILRKKLAIPLIFTFHSLGAKEFDADNVYPGRIVIEKKIVQEVEGLIVSTTIEKRDLIEYYQASNEKIFVVHPGVDHKVFKKYDRDYSRKKLGLPKAAKIVLFVGRIDPNKGISFLIKAVDKLIGKYSSFMNSLQVILIGGNIKSHSFWSHPEVRRVKKVIAEKDLDCCVKFIGSRPYRLLPYYYSAAEVVVMPSIYESFCLVVLEAMACGSCVLASSSGGLKYLIKDRLNGRLFESGNVEALSQLLSELLNDRKQRLKLGRRAFSDSQNFSWEKQAKEILEVYRHFL